MMLRKPDLYNKAISLRQRGFSYTEILKYVPVAQSTISRWCCEIHLSEQQKERLLQKKLDTILIRTKRRGAILSRKDAKSWVRRQIDVIGTIDKDVLLLVAGIILYWAEGTKLQDKAGGHKSVGFTNTDPKIIKIAMEFFRKTLFVPENKIKIMIRIGRGGNIERAERYWARITGVPGKGFQRPEILQLSKNTKSLDKYPHGMCRISIYDILTARKIAFLIEEFPKAK